MQFISPQSVTTTNGVASYPPSFNYVWADTTSPVFTVDAQVKTVIHISNWQGTEQQFELLTGGYFVDYSNVAIYRINACSYANPNGSGNVIDLHLNRVCNAVGAGLAFQVVPFNLCSMIFTVMVRLISGVGKVWNAANTGFTTMGEVGQRVTISPASNIRAYVEPILLDSTAVGILEASNSK